MPNPCDHKCDHNENRKKVCAPCGRKINLGVKKLQDFRISEDQELQIRRFINVNFAISNPQFPSSICVTCRQVLQDHKRQNDNRRPFKVMPNYEDMCLPKETRSHEKSNFICNCYICLTARHKGVINMKKKLPVGKTLDLSIKIVPDPFENIQKTIQLCSTCFQEVSRGTPHFCIPDTRSKTRAVENLEILAKRLPEKHRDQLCASLLDEKCSFSAGDPKIPVVLSTRGSTKRVFLKEVAEPKIFPAEALHSHQLDSGASGREMLKLGHLIRQNCGRKAVPAFFQKELSESNLMEDLYRHDILDFDVEKSSVKEKRPVVWGDAEELLENVVDRRDLIGNYSVKVMADGGQGFFKICMSIIPGNYVSESLQEGGPSRKKSKILKCTSVPKLIMQGIVLRIKETYENLKILFDLTKINNISMKFVSDFKLLLLVNGQQTATASFPCPY